VAVMVLVAAGGGAFVLVKTTGKRQTAPPGGHPPALTARTTAPPTRPVSTRSASPQASPSPSPSVVSIAPVVELAFPQVEVVLSHYFQGINDHNYAEYASSQTAQGKEAQSESSFDSGYATTTNSGMRLTSLTPMGNGDLTAAVTFTSRQSPSDSVDNSTCNNWTLKLNLVPNGTGYLIAPAPSGYEPIYTDC
jgi:hypothetical protein